MRVSAPLAFRQWRITAQALPMLSAMDASLLASPESAETAVKVSFLLNIGNAMLQEVRERHRRSNNRGIETLLPEPLRRNRDVSERVAANVVPYSEWSEVKRNGASVFLRNRISVTEVEGGGRVADA